MSGDPLGGAGLVRTVLAAGAGLVGALSLVGSLAGCPAEAPPDPALLDPATCASCHPSHVAEWAGSMHAYAFDDPVFQAMNAAAVASGEVEPDFCVSCHAPVALRLGATTDGTNLDEVPEPLRGVTCAFCHQLDGVHGAANAAVDWSLDGVMRGSLLDPLASTAHEVAYDPHLDRDARESSDACGACHDIVLPNGLHLEKTYAEWQASVFAEGRGRQECAHCHLPSREGRVAEVPGAPVRRVHDHAMPAVDVALIDWPDRERQRALIQELLDKTLAAELCVAAAAGGAEIALTLENQLAGHDVPSGASHDRRMWVEVVATRGEQELLRSGTVPEGTAMVDVADPNRAAFHDLARTADGGLSHGIVDAVSLEERALPGTPADGRPHARTVRWTVLGEPDRVEVAVHLRPIGLDVLRTHVDAGRLAPEVAARMPTFTFGGTELVWSGELGTCVGGLGG